MPKHDFFPRLQPFRHPRERELARWITMDGRLSEVEASLELLLTNLDAMPPGPTHVKDGGPSILVRSLYCFAVITYVRCFNKGRRLQLKIQDIPGLGRRQVELHGELVAVRNQHLAHAVSNEEEAYIFLRRDKGKVELKGFHVLHTVLASDNSAKIRRFIALVKRVRRYVFATVCQVGDEVARTFFSQRAKWKNLAC